MQHKKEVLLLGLLLAMSIGLLVASTTSERTDPCAAAGERPKACCQEKKGERSESFWNFITGGILHLSV